MKKIILFAMAIMVSLSLVYAQQGKIKEKRKVLLNGADYDLVQVGTYEDKQLIHSTYELSGTNLKYPIDTELKQIFTSELGAMKMMLDSAYKFLLTCDERSSSMYLKVQFVAIPKIKQGTHMMIVSRPDMMHLFQKSQLEKLIKAIQKIESNK